MHHPELAVVTIATRSHLAQARCLMQSVAAHLPEAERLILLVDGASEHDPAREGPERVLSGEEVGPMDFQQRAFSYTPLELCCSLKPTLLRRVLAEPQRRAVIYLDSDTKLYRRPRELLDRLESAPVVLVPHLVKPLEGGEFEEMRLRSSGVFNAGLIAASRCAESESFLSWWEGKLRRHCLFEPQRGFNLDQGWLDLAPCLFPEIGILREDGYNVAYWNLSEREISSAGGDAGRFKVNGRPLTLFHFSGFDPAHPLRLSKWHREPDPLDRQAPLALLLEDYSRELLDVGFDAAVGSDYAFGRFKNGVRVPTCARLWYRRMPDDLRGRWPDPFATSVATGSFLDYLNEPWEEAPTLTRCAAAFHSCWERKAGLFPRVPGSDSTAFGKWFASRGAAQHGLDDAFSEAQQALLGRRARQRTSSGNLGASLRTVGRLLAGRASASSTLQRLTPARLKTALWRLLVSDSRDRGRGND